MKKSSSASTSKSNSKKDGNDNDNPEKIQDSILARQRMLSAANVLDSWEALALWSCARGEVIYFSLYPLFPQCSCPLFKNGIELGSSLLLARRRVVGGCYKMEW